MAASDWRERGMIARTALMCLLMTTIAGKATIMSAGASHSLPPPPPLPREFRGAWVATVANIDWPSTPGLPVAQQQAEMIAILDKAVELHLNAIIFQVRPSCDALYESRIEPWSEYLTGAMGRAPQPLYDPLAFAVAEAHKRGLELHAWINPYRARHAEAASPVALGHISRTRPDLVKTYGASLWLDPGEPQVQDYSEAVILDIVRRYDVDGIHLDDYFYPYKEVDANKRTIPFPDDVSWSRYTAAGGTLTRDDWRRENVNAFIERVYHAIKAEKPWVKFGISPFGIWKPGYPSQIKGFNAYQEIYADSRKWLINGWCDYFCPQLYWKIEPAAQSYPVLLRWWRDQNIRERHIFPGSYTSQVADGSASPWRAQEIVDQVNATRAQQEGEGNIHFSMVALMHNQGGVAEALVSSVYGEPALPPAFPWLDPAAPATPHLHVDRDGPTDAPGLTWSGAESDHIRLWVVQTRRAARWSTSILPAERRSLVLHATDGHLPEEAAVTAVDRCGVASDPALVDLATPTLRPGR